MKRIIFIALIFLPYLSISQTYLKINGATAMAAIPNLGFETSIGNKTTFQLDALASFWESINGVPYKAIIVTPEIRYHFNNNFKGFYLGANISGGKFELQKYGYKDTNLYQRGYNYFIGITAGYKFHVSEKIFLDLFIGGGHQEAFYKAYDITSGERVDYWIKDYNKSGEMIPYRGGLMLSFKI